MYLAMQHRLEAKNVIILILQRRSPNNEVWSSYGALSDSSHAAKTGPPWRDDSSELMTVMSDESDESALIMCQYKHDSSTESMEY